MIDEEYPDSEEIYKEEQEEIPDIEIKDEEYPNTDTIYGKDRDSDKETFEKAKEFLKQKFKEYSKQPKNTSKVPPKKTKKIKPRKGRKVKLHLKPMPLPKNNISFGTSVGQNINVGFSKPNVKISSFGGYGENVNIAGKTPKPVQMSFAQQRIATQRAKLKYQIQLEKQRALKQDKKVQQTFMTKNRIGSMQGALPTFNVSGLSVVMHGQGVGVKKPAQGISRIRPMGITTPRKNKKNINHANHFNVVVPKFNVPVLRKFKKRGAK